MTDLTDFIVDITKDITHPEKADAGEIIAFLEDNDWFGKKPDFSSGKVLLDDEHIALYSEPLLFFLNNDAHSETLFPLLTKQFSHTSSLFRKFCDELKLSEDIRFYILDFLLYRLEKELSLYTDDDITGLLKLATFDLLKLHGDYFTFFLSWLKTRTKTNYQRDYILDKRYTMDIQNEAYDFSEYLELLYYLFNEDYIESNAMYEQAANSKNYTDTWLYLSMHFICSLRLTDLERIYHPTLPYPAEEVIERICDNTFSDNDARMVLLSITTRMCLLPFTPNKTSASSGVASVKFNIPSSCEVHFGKLFALAEAHRQIDGTTDTPIIRKISHYEEITRYMGEEIGSLFLMSDFRSRSATKSYLQSIYMLADDILCEGNDGPSIKGYILAALARSHKGAYGEFATTTFEYLKDAKLSGLTPEFIAFELLERGVLSFIPSMLLKMVTDGGYAKLTVSEQTQLVKTLDLSPREIESVVSVVEKARRQAELTVKELIDPETDIITVLHRIGSGQAFSKEPDCLCLMSALEKVCPFGTTRQCVGCKYEISTKSTLYLMISEYNRLRLLYSNTEDKLEKAKYKAILTTVIIPKMDEMLCCIKESYGDDAFTQYEQLIQENT